MNKYFEKMLHETLNKFINYSTSKALIPLSGTVLFGTEWDTIICILSVKITASYLFWLSFCWSTNSTKGSKEGGATHTAVCWLQAGKKLFLSCCRLLITSVSFFIFLHIIQPYVECTYILHQVQIPIKRCFRLFLATSAHSTSGQIL